VRFCKARCVAQAAKARRSVRPRCQKGAGRSTKARPPRSRGTSFLGHGASRYSYLAQQFGGLAREPVGRSSKAVQCPRAISRLGKAALHGIRSSASRKAADLAVRQRGSGVKFPAPDAIKLGHGRLRREAWATNVNQPPPNTFVCHRGGAICRKDRRKTVCSSDCVRTGFCNGHSRRLEGLRIHAEDEGYRPGCTTTGYMTGHAKNSSLFARKARPRGRQEDAMPSRSSRWRFGGKKRTPAPLGAMPGAFSLHSAQETSNSSGSGRRG